MITLFENFEKNDWQIGDIIVAKNNYTVGQYEFILKDQKLQIIEISEVGTIKVKDLNKVYHRYFHKYDFISLEEWEIKQNVKKYNL